MKVKKRDGSMQPVMFDKITARLKKLCYGFPPDTVDPLVVAQKVVYGVYDGVTSSELDDLAAETAANLTVTAPEYSLLAARIAISNLQKQTEKQFSTVIEALANYEVNGKRKPKISAEILDVVKKNAERLDAAMVFDRDFDYDYFGFKTLAHKYLMRIDDKIVERPQHMIMRVAIGIHKDDIEQAIASYNLMSVRKFTHATPTLYNAGTPNPQMSSCFLVQMKEDSIDGIFKTLHECAAISKTAGGIGLSISKIRAKNSYIAGSSGISNGLTPMLRVYDATARYVDQGGGKRKGAFAVYIEPWHDDIFEYLALRRNDGKEELKARDLFYGLWIPDLFMKRVENDEEWSLFCPNEAPGLNETWGDEFEKLFIEYEEENRFRRKVSARHLFATIIDSQIETGTPYMLYKDSANRKSNQQNLGTITHSNLCTEIIQHSNPEETAVCNLASISLPQFIGDGQFDFNELHKVTQVITRNLNKVIDGNYYPSECAKRSNMKHRPIGIGVQGLADTFLILRMPFESEEARALNLQIFEIIYHAALYASCELAEKEGTYESYYGSPISQGKLQPDLWGVETSDNGVMTKHSFGNWSTLRKSIKQYGVRNSLLVAPMPTATTAQILGNNECFEPYTSNMYTRGTLAGEFFVINAHLTKDLKKLGLN